MRWHVVRFLIDLQDPAPLGTVAYVRILPRQAYWLQSDSPHAQPCGLWFSHRYFESSQSGQMFQCPWPDLIVPGSPGCPSSELSAFSAKAFSHQQHQLLLAFVDLFEVVDELGKLQVAILRQQEGLPSLAQKLDKLSIVARADVCQA